jgi:hypothetical protein
MRANFYSQEKPLKGKKIYHSTASPARALRLCPFNFMGMSPLEPLLPPSRFRKMRSSEGKKKDEKERG